MILLKCRWAGRSMQKWHEYKNWRTEVFESETSEFVRNSKIISEDSFVLQLLAALAKEWRNITFSAEIVGLSRSQCPLGLRRQSAELGCCDCGLESRLGHGCFSCEYRVLSGRGQCVGLITRAGKYYRVWCGVVCVCVCVCVTVLVKPRKWRPWPEERPQRHRKERRNK